MGERNPYKRMNEITAIERMEARLRIYRKDASALLEGIIKPEGLIADLGCGSGNSTLEIAVRFPGRIIAMDSSPLQIQLARIKFGQDESDISGLSDRRIGEFISGFKEEASGHRDRVGFHILDASQMSSLIGPDALGLAVGNHIWHWLIKQGAEDRFLFTLGQTMREGGILALNTSSNFLEPRIYAKTEHSFLHHPLLRRFFSNLSETTIKETGFEAAARYPDPIMDHDDKVHRFNDAGFGLIRYDEHLSCIGYDPDTGREDQKLGVEMLIGYYMKALPDHLAFFHGSGISESMKQALIDRAIARAIDEAGRDMHHSGHIYDPNPMFVFRKL